jgi:hypothetical protein
MMMMGNGPNKKIGWFGVALGLFAGPVALAQMSRTLPLGEAASITSASTLPTQIPAERILREFDDSNNGVRWLLVRDESHPGGPGRLVPVMGSVPTPQWKSTEKGKTPVVQSIAKVANPGTAAPSLIVRAGDRLIVEEHTRVADVHLEAVALGSATAGAALNVRLKLGGKVLRAIVIEPGRATLQTETEARP